MTMTLALSSRLDTGAAGPLRQSLKKLVEERAPLAIDGSAVEQIGQACLQVLYAARASAAEQGLSYQLTNPSEPLVEAASLAALAVFDPA
ncbi:MULTISPECIES: STAS domain-containing protein [Sphingomonas]|nr:MULTISPECIES: STAS domain-containing protein [Sphingomonas]